MKAILSAAVLLSTASFASAQSTIYGLDFRMDRFYMSDTANFVGNFTAVGAPNAESLFAMDFDATATTLWAIHNTTNMYGTVSLTTGAFTPLGPVTGGSVGATGLTAAVDGMWYLSEFDGANTNLYVGDATTGTFMFVGVILAGIVIDISIDSQGNLYGNVINDDSLYSINTATGAGTLIGPTGQATNFAQGMDFDWSTDTLYATLYTGGGTGVFASISLTTGLATVLADTTSLNAEMEMAVQEPGSASGPIGMTDPGCMPLSNSIGTVPLVSLVGTGAAGDDVTAQLTNGKPSEFGYWISGPNTGTIPAGCGIVCIGSPQFRYNSAANGHLFQFDAGGVSQTVGGAGPNILPTDGSFGPVPAVMVGATRSFQGWYRDAGCPAPNQAYNFSNSVRVTFN